MTPPSTRPSTQAVARPGRRRITLAVATLALAALDVGLKQLAEAQLPGKSIDLGVIRLQLAHNSGVAFSIGDRLPAGAVTVVTAAITLAIASYAWNAAPTAARLRLAAGSAILAGASANLVDRARDGVVTDYLHTGWFPTFNLADSYLTVGVAVLILAELIARPPTRDATPTAGRDHGEPST